MRVCSYRVPSGSAARRVWFGRMWCQSYSGLEVPVGHFLERASAEESMALRGGEVGDQRAICVRGKVITGARKTPFQM